MKDYYGKDITALKNKKLFLFDMDGTIYRENDLFDMLDSKKYGKN